MGLSLKCCGKTIPLLYLSNTLIWVILFGRKLLIKDYCSSPSTKHSRPAAMPKLPLRNLSNAELLFSYKTHQSILQAPFSFPPPSKTQKVRTFGSKSSFQTIANRQEASFYSHQASNIRYCIIKTHLILLVFVLGSSVFRR